MGLLATFALGAALLAAPADSGSARLRTVSVRLHDYAHLDRRELQVTEGQVSAIYAAIGIAIAWREPVRPDEVQAGLRDWPADPAPELTVLIMSSAMARLVGISDSVAGYAAVAERGGGSVAFSVAERTRRIATCAGVPHARVLASVIAHELGHLLMPQRGHGRSGIMRPQWRPAEFRDLRQLLFSPDEAEAIRTSVDRLHVTLSTANN